MLRQFPDRAKAAASVFPSEWSSDSFVRTFFFFVRNMSETGDMIKAEKKEAKIMEILKTDSSTLKKK